MSDEGVRSEPASRAKRKHLLPVSLGFVFVVVFALAYLSGYWQWSFRNRLPENATGPITGQAGDTSPPSPLSPDASIVQGSPAVLRAPAAQAVIAPKRDELAERVEGIKAQRAPGTDRVVSGPTLPPPVIAEKTGRDIRPVNKKNASPKSDDGSGDGAWTIEDTKNMAHFWRAVKTVDRAFALCIFRTSEGGYNLQSMSEEDKWEFSRLMKKASVEANLVHRNRLKLIDVDFPQAFGNLIEASELMRKSIVSGRTDPKARDAWNRWASWWKGNHKQLNVPGAEFADD